jgi:hypothetical protein
VRWVNSWRADPVARVVADRHYNRQKVGSRQFVPPGRCLVLRTLDGRAVWVTSWPFAQYVKHAWAGAWVNSLFRREGGPRASDLIRDAVAATGAVWSPPEIGIVSFVDPGEVKAKRDPGFCYLMAGWKLVGLTKAGLWVYQQLPEAMPWPVAARVA